MKKLFLLLAVFGMIFTACSPVDDGNDNNAEQPGEETVFITDYEGNIVVGADGGVVVVTVSTNLEYSVEIPEEAQSWLSIADTRAIRLEKLTFTVAKNEADAERRAIVKLLGSDNAELQSLLFIQEGATAEETQAIKFQDENTKLLCTLHWDENEDGELSYEEAAAVTDLGTAFKGSSILAFSELEYFTSLEKIADSAFEGCVSLVKITLPEQVTAIGTSAFNGCTNLKKITVPDSVTSIGERAFDGCTSLARVDISDLSAWCKIGFGDYDANPLINGAKLYLDNNEITALTIPSDITEIKNYAFRGCSSLTSVTIPDSVTEIGEYAFSSCSSLTSVTIPDSVTSIGRSAFSSCSSLTSVTIGNSVTKIGEYAFYKCTSLTSVTIPDSVTEIGGEAFSGCTGELIINGKIVEKDYTSNSYPANYSGWLYGSRFTKLTIGDSVTKIGEYAFYQCYSLTSVTIPDSVTSIGKSAFWGCTSLTRVDISDLSAWCKIGFGDNANPLINGAKLYLDNNEITALTIPSDITEIKNYAFHGYSSLTSVTIPDSVTSIGRSAFSDCTGELIINNKIVETDYTSDNYPAKFGWLYGSKFTKLTIGDSVTSIGARAFKDCTNLTSITIPDSVTSIGNNAFEGCISLTSVTIPDSVTSIGSSAFYGCTSLASVTIGNSVTSIGSSAFYYCTSLASVTIGNSVTSIGSSAFYYCYSLKEVYCKPTTPPAGGSGMFSNNASGRKIYVPRASVDAYKAANRWKDYASDIEGYDF